MKRSVGAAVGEGGSRVARTSIDGPFSGGDSSRRVRSIRDVIGVERGDRAGGGRRVVERREKESILLPLVP